MSETLYWIGTYTQPGDHARDIQGAGILRCWIDDDRGALRLETASTRTPDPSYLAIRGNVLYAVSEKMGQPGELHRYRCSPVGSLELIDTVGTGGGNACFLVPHGKQLLVANYMSTALAVLEPKAAGGWERHHGEPYQGSGPDRVRQEAPHPHHCAYLAASEQVGVCDLGTDRVWLHAASSGQVSSAIAGWIQLPPGTGPRHSLSRGNDLYILGELSGQLHHYRWTQESWQAVTVCAPVNEDPWCAALHLHPHAPVLYVSERHSSRLYGYALDPESGRPGLKYTVTSPAQTPRDFGFSPNGKWLIVLGQDSSSIALHALDPMTAHPLAEKPLIYPCGSPVSIVADEIERCAARRR